MNAFFRRLADALAQGPVALATVVAARGSTPRIAGARQFLTATGDSTGTIGGGVAEARTLDLARETLADGRPRTFEVDLRGRPGDVRDGVCGGTMTLWIVRLDPRRDLGLIREIERELRAGRPVALATRFDESLPLTSDPASAAPDAEAFREILEPAPRLLIVGAGHIGRALAHLATNLDFDVVVQDDRPEWLAPAAFPPHCTLEPTLANAAETLRHWPSERFAALVTRGFPQDLAALHALAGLSGLRYLGLLGSRTRVATVLAAWRTDGGSTPPEGVLHAPIGIEIGAETPAEIAVSIAAEIIRVRRRHREAAARAAS